ncbi:MotA/TolQ/ExbB proton channel family protein [Stratiformator vulcanicus]|uniref:MotA/TolQ/ExbB proton channel family protein n=1 Tax=Stratiformator vulcanicus TaxID=2527980 RepID=A0A517R0R3_9PLAN|nr:MotA/TolQ/ExbB proton channel family protein [Stratiformator vulcanicus]QDT37461.1 MotA/TolQ/ExbB proton channel family protein [Stratiformator vulcanicus]
MPVSLDSLSGISTLVIAGFCGAHVLAFAVLSIWAGRDLRVIASSLDQFTRSLRHRSILEGTAGLADQIQAFLADVREVLDNPKAVEERRSLLDRIKVLDEKRGYLNSLSFETAWNVARTMIEAYPLAGVLGTILAIGSALAGDASTGDASAVSVIVARFGDAIWSTFAGLTAAILLMFLSSILEPRFARLTESRANVRDVIARAKRELTVSGEKPE